ncbi:aminopeptidase P family protein [Streptomyces caatingaensis]|uniref:Peptidase M24 n=1 Tax=Streptomyces caatingaensis TaxID=1678637 RepID=A0A0K9XEB8_9ACTN|nr:aminopeptidase P family protein [Streptomyces caatingaensis]KNB51456.1 peptidase M24 [Streptomyces caatingaensis]
MTADPASAGTATPDDYAARMERAARAAAQEGLSGLIVSPGPDLVWLCGYRASPGAERLTALILVPGRRPLLIVPELERGGAERAPGAGALTVTGWRDAENPYDLAAGHLDVRGRYGVSDNTWALHLLALQRLRPGAGYAALTEALPMLRAVKDASEVERLAAAGAAADAVYEAVVERPFAGRCELDVAADLDRLLREHGHSQVDFTIVGSGPNGADPHHDSGDRVIEDGDMVVMDFGGLLAGYGSDTTRTVHVGEPTAEERKVHDIVREAQQAAFEAVRPGAACQDIDRAARSVIVRHGFGEYFVHRTGHGIGVTTHEPPYMVEGEHQPLVPGMCFSIEPGIYLPGRFGVRIEDIVVCGEEGGRRLNTTSRELRVVR